MDLDHLSHFFLHNVAQGNDLVVEVVSVRLNRFNGRNQGLVLNILTHQHMIWRFLWSCHIVNFILLRRQVILSSRFINLLHLTLKLLTPRLPESPCPNQLLLGCRSCTLLIAGGQSALPGILRWERIGVRRATGRIGHDCLRWSLALQQEVQVIQIESKPWSWVGLFGFWKMLLAFQG